MADRVGGTRGSGMFGVGSQLTTAANLRGSKSACCATWQWPHRRPKTRPGWKPLFEANQARATG